MMIGSISATALVSYRGVAQTVPRDAVQPVQPVPSTKTDDLRRPQHQRVRVAGMPGMLVDLIA